jgi:hypothetical protein
MTPGKELVEQELMNAIRTNQCIKMILKRKVGKFVLTALDSLSEMETDDRIKIESDDIEKMRYARFHGTWRSKQEKDRTVTIQLGRLFQPSVFLENVEPSLYMISTCKPI